MGGVGGGRNGAEGKIRTIRSILRPFSPAVLSQSASLVDFGRLRRWLLLGLAACPLARGSEVPPRLAVQSFGIGLIAARF
jgi:hypothetical protein